MLVLKVLDLLLQNVSRDFGICCLVIANSEKGDAPFVCIKKVELLRSGSL